MLDVSRIRRDFPILSKLVYGRPLVYLDNAATSQKPASVIQALVDYYEGYNANVHRGVHALSMESTQRYEEAREKVVRFIGAPDSENLIFVRNTTEGINLVASTWAAANVGPGDEILLTEMEHHSNLVPWQQLAKEKKRTAALYPGDGRGNLGLVQLGLPSKPPHQAVGHNSHVQCSGNHQSCKRPGTKGPRRGRPRAH